ncbi:hypothetical protein [Curtobacterium ammoniigenes]|uniref:hypothetical protein n=1 Tax=Curtobacterium ammoniigenes TaxID=395387 RepID=UPI00083671F8|nr:hypothetical protein [Curtobacterium ammoniigenes]
MRKALAAAVIGIAVVGAAGVAAPASAATFTGWSNTNYSGSILVQSSTTANTTVDVADNLLSSAKNAQSRRWCAVNVEAGINIIRFRFAQGSYSTLGTMNRVTDFLWAGTAGGCA